jgi:hypothetical protein
MSENFSGNPYIVLTNHLSDPGEPIPKYYLNPDSLEYYACACYQVSMYPMTSKNDVNVLDILNESGKELYRCIQNKCQNEPPKNTLEMYSIRYVNSGSWFADETSHYYTDNPDSYKGSFNTFQNMIIHGKIKDTDEWMQTSPCIFVNEKEGWCFTKSGNHYKLINKEQK